MLSRARRARIVNGRNAVRIRSIGSLRKYYKDLGTPSVSLRHSKLAKDRLEGGTGGAAATGMQPLDSSGSHAGVLTEEMQPMPDSHNLREREEAHWRKTSRLMLINLGIWFIFGYVIHMFVVPLNTIQVPILGFPLGFYMAAQGSLIAFVVILFVFARQQDRIDREFGFAEDDQEG